MPSQMSVKKKCCFYNLLLKDFENSFRRILTAI